MVPSFVAVLATRDGDEQLAVAVEVRPDHRLVHRGRVAERAARRGPRTRTYGSNAFRGGIAPEHPHLARHGVHRERVEQDYFAALATLAGHERGELTLGGDRADVAAEEAVGVVDAGYEDLATRQQVETVAVA